MKGPPILALALLALLSAAAPAAPPPEPYRVGVLFWHRVSNDLRAYEGVRDGFRFAAMDWRPEVVDADYDRERARAALRRWESEGFDLVYALGTSAALLAKEEVRETPVVFTAVTNPKGSLEIPWEGSGRNLCGNSNWIPAPEKLEAFRRAVPGLARLGVVYNTENPVPMEEVAEAKEFFRANEKKRLGLIEEWVRGTEDLEEAVASVLERGAQAVWVPIDHHVYENLDRIARITMPRGVLLVSSQRSAVDTHAVVGVAVDYHALGMRSVVLAEKVLRRGADPGELPVGRMSSFQVIVNLQAARRAGCQLPLPFLAAADVILDPAREQR